MTEIERAAAETERLCHELDIANADHIVLWLETNLRHYVAIAPREGAPALEARD